MRKGLIRYEPDHTEWPGGDIENFVSIFRALEVDDGHPLPVHESVSAPVIDTGVGPQLL